MSIERSRDKQFVSDEDLFFQRLFAEEELSERKTSKTTSTFKTPFKHHIPSPPNFSQILFSQATQNRPYSSHSKTVAKVQPHTSTQIPTASWQPRPKFDEFVDFDLSREQISKLNEGSRLEYEDQEYDHPVANSFQTPSQMVLNVPSRGGVKGNGQQLRSVAEIPEQFRSIFSSFPYFNFVQSKVLDDVLYTDKPVVVCSPTGSGKTAVFELAIIRLLMNFPERHCKIVYMAPMKALCSERYEDWSKKFSAVGMKCKELTGDSEMEDYFELQNADIVMTTPEKWDSMTRKWKDNRSLVQTVRLFLIDEVHLLNDESRGPSMEAVISRMKTVKTAQSRARNQKEIFGANMRFLAISATIPNAHDPVKASQFVRDVYCRMVIWLNKSGFFRERTIQTTAAGCKLKIGLWLGTEENPSATYSMDDSYRPVKLRKVVIGYSCNENTTNFKFDLSLNYKLSGIIHTYSENKPTLVFCSTRKGAQQAGSTLIKDARYVMNSEHRQRLQRCANSLHDSKLRELVMCGVAYHHAGLDSSDRKSIEAMFTNGDLPVLFATSTLAMGVNLPAHLVIIKSTMQYVKGVFEEYSESQILQMTGRAGRPQFDDSATAVIMTKLSNKMKYEAVIGGTQNIESSLHKNLIEHLNAEIVLNTITDVSIALEWLKSTFLYIRILKNPTYYGIPEDLDMDVLETKLQEMCVESLNTLRDHGLINMDEGFDLKPTDTGKLMARYYLAFESMKLFLGLQGSEDLNELVNVVCQCKEFIDLKLRNNEKKVLNTLNKDKNRVTIRFPINGKIKTTEQKISCLLQATLGCLPINEFTLNQDVTKIFRSGQRISKCLYEFCMLQSNSNLLMNALQLSKCFRARIWENSKYVSKQLEKVGLTMSTMLVNAGLTTFQKIEETNPRQIELIVNRHPPFGNQIKEAVASLPKYEVDVEQKSNYSVSTAELVISVTMVNYIKRQDSGKSTGFHYCILLIADTDNQIVLKQRLSDAVFFATGIWSKKIEVKRAYSSSEITISVVSQDIVGLDVQKIFIPYYTGPYIDHNKHPTIPRRNKIPVKVAPEETGMKKQEEKRQPCNHRCINKHLCAHECCKVGVIPKKSASKGSNMNQNIKTSKNENSNRSRESKLDTFVDQLHARNQLIPTTPGRKRLVAQSTGTGFDFSGSGSGKSILSQYEYNRKAKMPRVGVQQTEDIEEFEDDDWLDMDFYEDNIKTGNSATRDRITIDLTGSDVDCKVTGDIWEQEFESDDDDDWYLEYSFLGEKPKQPTTHGSSEPSDNALHQQFLDTNTNIIQKPTLSSCQKKTQNNASSKSGEVNRYRVHQPPVRPSPSYQPMTNTKCSSFPRPDPIQNNSYFCGKKPTQANHEASSTKQPPKPSLCKPNRYKSSILPGSKPGPSGNTRPSHSPLHRWSTNQLCDKIRPHKGFVTASDVAKTALKRQSEMNCQERSIYKNTFSSSGHGIVNQPSSNHIHVQKEVYNLKYKPAAQKSQTRSQYFSSDIYSRDRNEISTNLVGEHNNLLSTAQHVVSLAKKPPHEAREQSVHQSSPEYVISPEYGIFAGGDAPNPTSDTAVTRSFHKPRYKNILQERSTNVPPGKECESSWGNPVVSKSDSEDENEDAFKNIFTDVINMH